MPIERSKFLFVAKRLKKLQKAVKKTEKKLYKKLLKEFINELEVYNGEVKDSANNLKLIRELDKVFKSFNSKEHLSLIKRYKDDLLGIGEFNKSYFDDLIEKSSNKINETILERSFSILGIEKKGLNTSIKKGGYLDLFLSDIVIKTQIKRRGLLAIQSGMQIKDLRTLIVADIISTNKKEGLLKKYWRVNAYDTYSAFDRSTAKAYADEYKLEACLYSAGTESDSRYLCVHSVGKIFLRKEVEELKLYANKKKEIEGKMVVIGAIVEDKNAYNPFIIQGGINCKHSWRWISNRFALRKDKSLYEVEGVLMRMEGKNPNKKALE